MNRSIACAIMVLSGSVILAVSSYCLANGTILCGPESDVPNRLMRGYTLFHLNLKIGQGLVLFGVVAFVIEALVGWWRPRNLSVAAPTTEPTENAK